MAEDDCRARSMSDRGAMEAAASVGTRSRCLQSGAIAEAGSGPLRWDAGSKGSADETIEQINPADGLKTRLKTLEIGVLPQPASITPLTMVVVPRRTWERLVRKANSGHSSKPIRLAVARAALAALRERPFFRTSSSQVLQEGVGQEHQHHVVMPTAPRAALEMVQSQFVLQFAIAVLDPPTALGRGYQSFQARRRR